MREARVVASLGRCLRPLPPELIHTAVGRPIRRSYGRRLRESGMPELRAPDLQSHWHELPAAIRDAVKRRGGPDAVAATVVRVARETPAAAFSLLAAHPRWRGRALLGPAWEQLADLAGRGPMILAVPYLGAHLSIVVTLLGRGIDVATFVGSDAERLLGELPGMAAATGGAGQLDLIPVPSTSAAIRADRALRRGSTIIWRPDTIPSWEVDLLSSASGRPTPWAHLAGLDVPASRLILRLAERWKIRPVVATAAYDLQHMPRARLRLTTMDEGGPEVLPQRMYDTLSEHLCSDVDQWTILLHPELLVDFQRRAALSASG